MNAICSADNRLTLFGEAKRMTISSVKMHVRGEIVSESTSKDKWSDMFRVFHRTHLDCFSLIVLLAMLLLLRPVGFSQTAGGEIAGNVTDSSGAVVTGAKVTTTNEKTGSVY